MNNSLFNEMFKSYLHTGTFNIYVEHNNLYINGVLITKDGYPKLNQDHIDILKQRLMGSTYTDIANKYGVTKQRIYSICKNATVILKKRYFLMLLKK